VSSNVSFVKKLQEKNMSYKTNHTPRPPEYSVNWQQISDRFDWIRAMKGVEQNSAFHGEGDVSIHTRMVAEALVSMPAWQQLPPFYREVLFAAALLHDVAKPITTVFEENRWTSPKHTVKGEYMARQLLWKGEAGPIPDRDTREEIAKLVRLHGLPLRFIDKPDPQRAIFEASLHVNLERLALLAEADVRGRICEGKQELLDRIELFREFAQENNCYTTPAVFQNDHHRFMYFVGHKAYEYVPYDDYQFTVILMCGLPGSGKTTWITSRYNDTFPTVSLDDLREELDISPDDADAQGEVARQAKERAKELLRSKKPFIWDATNIIRDYRSAAIALCASYGAKTHIQYIETSVEDALRRNRSRKRQVPESVIHRMFERFEYPTNVECHSVSYEDSVG
jgi:putative nucleotidyltransferase with HDIG domain